ncbi:hypothetical protein LXA43DRAFT_1100283 [Ganoderma leucocontextum]|nr:hypothetical protein LXA43DRAFT_1100283 [Ganoderma leucocontextum]
MLACVAVSSCRDVVYAVQWYLDPLNAIPTAVGGSSLPGLSYSTAWRTQRNFKEVIEEGYKKYPESAFKVAVRLPEFWVVVFSGRRMVEELRKRPEEELSISLVPQEVLQSQYAVEPPLLSDRSQMQIMKTKLTARKLPDILGDVIDELTAAVREMIFQPKRMVGWWAIYGRKYLYGGWRDLHDIDWTSLHVLPAMPGLRWAPTVANHARALQRVPGFVKPLVAPFVHDVKRHTSLVVPHLRPIIVERRKAFAEVGEGWGDKPLILDKAIPKGNR